MAYKRENQEKTPLKEPLAGGHSPAPIHSPIAIKFHREAEKALTEFYKEAEETIYKIDFEVILKQLDTVKEGLTESLKETINQATQNTKVAAYLAQSIIRIAKITQEAIQAEAEEAEKQDKHITVQEIIEQATKDIVKQDIEEIEGFYLLAQSQASNKLTRKLIERMAEPAQFDIYGNGSIAETDFRLFVKGYRELANGVNETAARLLDSLMITATRNGLKDTRVILPIKEYLDMRGLKDEKEIRQQVKRDINALERISFEYRGTGKKKGQWLKVSISGGTVGQIKNGDIVFRFNQDFFDSFKVGAKILYMYFPREGLKGNIKENPWKYWLARKISEHKRMNIGKPNEDIISVQTLIDACPNFPTYEKVMSEDRHINRRIIEPFERDLDALSPSISWEYQSLNKSPRNYQEFITANIVIHWGTYPDTKKLEAGKKKRAKKQQADKEKKRAKRGGETPQKGG
jgi:hypothetical protein